MCRVVVEWGGGGRAVTTGGCSECDTTHNLKGVHNRGQVLVEGPDPTLLLFNHRVSRLVNLSNPQMISMPLPPKWS